MTGPLDSPGFWLHQAALAWAADLGARLAPLDLTPTQFTLLAATNWLGKDGPVNQQAVADFAGSDRMMASRVLRSLESRGLVVRLPDPASRRSLLLRTTAEGSSLVHRAVAAAAEADARMFGDDRSNWRERLRPLAVRRSGTGS